MTHKKTDKRRRTVSEHEKALWEVFTRDVKPLRHKRKRGAAGDFMEFAELLGDGGDSANGGGGINPAGAGMVDNLPAAIARAEQNRQMRNLPSARDADHIAQIPRQDQGELQPGITHGIDRSTARKFQKGRMDIDGRIDLHGMTQEVAHRALVNFVDESWRAGKRCLLVITGKGSRADEYGRTGLLRQRTPVWLSAPDIRERILAINHAQIQHGGAGAFYVLLKRRRQ